LIQIKMQIKLLVNKKNIYNKVLHELYKKNYSDNLEFPPDYQYDIILHWNDYWFHFVNEYDEIIACCSITISDEYYGIHDVLVEEKFRGNNYAELLIMNVLHYFDKDNIKFKITTNITNIAAIKTYKKIFGEPKNSDNKFIYFYL